MPKTIAITPSWYWPPGVPRVLGIPPFAVTELCVDRPARDHPGALAFVAGNTRLTSAELRDEVHQRAARLAALGAAGGPATIPASLDGDTVLLFLAALAAGLRVRLVPPGSPAGSDTVLDDARVSGAEPGAVPLPPPAATLREPAVAIPGRISEVWHSHRSLMGAALSLAAFLEVEPGRPWVPLIPPFRWEGILSLLLPLYLGSPLVLPPANGDAEATVSLMVRERAGYAFADLPEAARLTRDAKKAVKDARKLLAGFLLSVDGMFDPDERRRVGRSFECPALTVWGLPETGPVFAAHQSWYMDEPVGIPITNAQVVPSDPRTGIAIQTLWELVDSAEVTVWSPSLCCTGTEGSAPTSWASARFRTAMLASSDANGMVYLLGPYSGLVDRL